MGGQDSGGEGLPAGIGPDKGPSVSLSCHLGGAGEGMLLAFQSPQGGTHPLLQQGSGAAVGPARDWVEISLEQEANGWGLATCLYSSLSTVPVSERGYRLRDFPAGRSCSCLPRGWWGWWPASGSSSQPTPLSRLPLQLASLPSVENLPSVFCVAGPSLAVPCLSPSPQISTPSRCFCLYCLHSLRNPS